MLEFPSPVLSINSSDLYDLIRDHCGQEIVDLILAQKIYDVQTLLRVENVFAIIDLPTNHYRDLKEKVAIQLLDGTWSVFVGLQARVDYFMTSLKQQAKSEETAGADTSHSASSVDRITVSKATIENFPVLGALITFFSKMENCPTMENYTPITSLIKSISTNLIRSKNNYRYSDYVYRFAVAFFIYAGRNAYRMMSLNIPGLLPSTTTIRKILRKTSFRMNEADFRFDEMVKYFTILDTRYAFGAEDCTSAVVKVIYDSQSNAFIGFDTPIESGKPLSNAHRTDSFAELKSWFEEKRKATLINIHMVQPLFNSASHRFSAPFFLSSYGIDGKYAADVVLDRYLWIYNESKRNGIRMLGFSSDADPRFMRAMRVASGLFICNPDQRFVTHPDVFEVDVCQWKWFLIRSKQLCVFMQVSFQ